MEQKRALSKLQFAKSDFRAEGYVFADKVGEFIATLDFKRWGNKCNLMAYMTLENGEKILCCAWNNTNYFGLGEIEIGATIKVNFETNSKGRVCLKSVERMD